MQGREDVSYDGRWGYHPLVVSLANTGEPLFIYNRSGNRPSHAGAEGYIDKAISLVKRAGFKTIMVRGDSDFSLTKNFDRWNAAGVSFVFGYDAKPNMIEAADALPEKMYSELVRKAEEQFGATKRMEFRTFVQAFIMIPAQIVTAGRRIVCRPLAWNPWQHVFFRLLDAFQT